MVTRPICARMNTWSVCWEERCEHVASAINKVPVLACRMPEGAFYAWIDIRKTGEASASFCTRLLREQHVALVPGAAFGPNGEGYVRMTCVKSWADLEEGLSKIARFSRTPPVRSARC